MRLGRAEGVLVLLTPAGATAGVDTRGAPAGTRELDLLDPSALVPRVHAIVLTTGSLAVAGGAVSWLAEHHHGYPVGAEPDWVVPIVPTAALGVDPTPDAYRACATATEPPPAAYALVGPTSAAAVVVVDALLTKAECRRVAMSAQDAFPRAGLTLPTTVFAVATDNPVEASVNALCTAAANALLTALG
ncbi:peptidase S58, DmpA [Actinosynnema sp. NPDC020468]|uniref:peptidase S58, DmpA n=1 Tax=Actinosynnema sp. NPDC020468 TaxID=3154488 RepID=UPI0033FDFA21